MSDCDIVQLGQIRSLTAEALKAPHEYNSAAVEGLISIWQNAVWERLRRDRNWAGRHEDF